MEAKDRFLMAAWNFQTDLGSSSKRRCVADMRNLRDQVLEKLLSGGAPG